MGEENNNTETLVELAKEQGKQEAQIEQQEEKIEEQKEQIESLQSNQRWTDENISSFYNRFYELEQKVTDMENRVYFLENPPQTEETTENPAEKTTETTSEESNETIIEQVENHEEVTSESQPKKRRAGGSWGLI